MKQISLPSRLTVSKEGDHFLVDNPLECGTPPVGRGRTIKEAIGDWLHTNQSRLGLSFDVVGAARETEERRRHRELRKR